MWIVKNSLKGTLKFRGLPVEIPAGEQFDLDSLGRSRAEASDQIAVAFEEGYLENVYKAPQRDGAPEAAPAGAAPLSADGVTRAHFDARLADFKTEFLDELRRQLDVLPKLEDGRDRERMDEVRAAISNDMQELVGELKLVRERFASVKGRIQDDPSLSEAEVRARLAFLEEQERELLKNFETVGRQVEVNEEDGDVMDKADLLANL